jgi:hypothetical protein
MNIKELIKTAKELHEKNIPACCWDEHEFGLNTESGHHTGTRDDMQAALGRPLNCREKSCLGLSRAYGWNGLPEDVSAELTNFLWPEGNHGGRFLPWSLLASLMMDFQFAKGV